MDDLIRRNALIKDLNQEEDECEDCMIMPSWHSALKILDEQPTVDAVPVEEIKLHIAKLKDNMEKYGSNQIDLGRMLALTELIERKESVNSD